MHLPTFIRSTLLGLFLAAVSPALFAHCDALDGPVIRDARLALDRRDATPVLKWVRQADETAIREAFRQALAVRGLGDNARQLADRHFFETLVRVHRAGEGEGFTGLKPAGSTEPGLAAADRALESGKVDTLADEMAARLAQGIRARFKIAEERRRHANDSVEAGRAYVAAYVDYIHFVEAVHRLASQGAGHAGHEPAQGQEPVHGHEHR